MTRQGDHRAALTLDWYAGTEKTQRQLIGLVPPIDRARTLLAWADRAQNATIAAPGALRQGRRRVRVGRPRRAGGIAGERGEDFSGRARSGRASPRCSPRRARTSTRPGSRASTCRARRCAPATRPAAREAVVAAVHLLEEAADRYETIGQRERAFDCYQVLIADRQREPASSSTCSRATSTSSASCARITSAITRSRSYEEAVAAAEKQGEVARRRRSRGRWSHTRAKKGSATSRASRRSPRRASGRRSRSPSTEAARAAGDRRERAPRGGASRSGRPGQYRRVGAVYGALAELPLEESRG